MTSEADVLVSDLWALSDIHMTTCCEVSSNHSNDYYFMWQRDAAMSMRSLLRVIVDAPNRTFASSMSNLASLACCGVLGVISIEAFDNS